MGAVEEVTRQALALSSREQKIQFMMAFEGIGPKYGRNIWMDLYDADFRQSIAVDSRLTRVSRALGFRFGMDEYTAHEELFRELAADAGLEPWELDRLLYQNVDWFLGAVE